MMRYVFLQINEEHLNEIVHSYFTLQSVSYPHLGSTDSIPVEVISGAEYFICSPPYNLLNILKLYISNLSNSLLVLFILFSSNTYYSYNMY